MAKPNKESCDLEKFFLAKHDSDHDAVLLVLSQYESQIRSIVRHHLHGRGLRSLCDSVDVFQSVVATFLEKALDRRYHFRDQSDVLRMLATIAINKIRNKARRERRYECAPVGDQLCSCQETDPQELASSRELAGLAASLLTPREQYLFQATRHDGRRWDELAAELGQTSDSLRMQLRRALERVRLQLTGESYP